MKRILLTGLCSLMLFVGIKAQTTVTITATGTAGSFNTGSVNSGGTKNDGDMITINSGANAGWAKFDLSSLPPSAVVTAVSCAFTTYSTTSSTAANNLYGFIGDPAVIAGTTLYTNCTSGTTFNNTSWTANATNTKVLNAAGVSFVASNVTSTQLCIGYARASTNTYNIYGYGAAAASKPQIIITYSVPPACSGTPTSGTATASSTVFCTPRTINLNLAGSTSATGLTYQWLSSPNGVSYSSIPTATNIAYSPLVNSTTYFQCVVSCGVNSSTSTPVMINYGPTPTGGTSVASQTYICASPSVALSTTGSSAVSGTTYQWQSSPNGSTWTSIPSLTLATANPTISTTTYYQNVLTCGTNTAASSPIMVTVAPTVTNSVSYSEGFEGITANDQLPNCSWGASSLGSICKTYTAATGSYNQIPKTGSKFASFRYGTASTGDYFYTNGIQLNTGTTYSASAGFITDGLSGWSEFSLLVGASQSTTGLSNIASATGALTNTVYVNVSNTFTVASSGIYYIAVKAIGNSSPWYLTFDDISVISVANPPVPNAVGLNLAGSQCTAAARTVTANITPGTNPLTSVVLNYSFNGVAQPTVALTGGNTTATSNWTGTIPVATPANANVTWTVTANDVTYARALAGTSYNDEPASLFVATASVTPSPVCAGNTATLSINLSSTNTSTYCSIAAASSTASYFDGFSTTGGVSNITNNATGFSVNGFGNYAALSASQKIGQSINFNTILAGTTVGVAIWVDWDQSGSFDVSERVYNTTSYVSSASGSFVVPAGARLGATRMRIFMDYNNSNPASPCGPFGAGRGEAEDYTFVVLPASSVYTWNNGVTSFTTTATTSTITVSSSSTYTASTLIGGCPLSASVQVNSTPIPAAPTVTNSSQCGNGQPTAMVGGGSLYKWYATPTSTTVLQSSASPFYAVSISTTTTFYVSSAVGTCESSRTALMASVTQPDAVTATTSAANICPAGTVTLTAVQSGTNNPYTFSWVASPVSGSGLSSSVPGQSIAVSPTAPGTYAYNVTATDGICTTTAVVNVTLNNPPVINATANPTVICSGANVSLNATTPVVAAGSSTVGTGTNLTSSTSYPTAFGNYWYQTWQQYLFTAAELNALGLTAGNITSLKFNIAATPNPNTTITDYNVKIAPTSNTALSAFVTTGLVNVFGPASVTAATGINTITFATPYNWDGVSNIVVDLRQTEFFGNGNATTYYTTTTNNSVLYAYSTSSNATFWTSSPAPTTSTSRPNIIFAGQVQTQSAGSLTWQWNPGAINSNTATVNPVNTGTAAATQVYTITANNPSTTCSNTATVSVLVNPLPATPTAFNSTQCGLGVPTASVSGGTTYKWYATPTATTALQTSTSATYTTSINATTNFYVASYNGTCESVRALVTASVTIPDGVTASSTSTAVCPGSTFTLTATKSGSTNTYAYTWTASPAAGSGIPTSATGATTAVTPTTPGTYGYLVTAVDGVCTTTASVNVTLNTPPNITNAMATPTMVCSGSTVGLSAISVNALAGTAATGLQSTTSITGGPYRQGAGSDNKAQYLFTAAELTAAGFAPGNFTALSFNVTSNGVGTMNNFTIKMGNTASTSLNTAYDAAPPVVLGPVAYTTVAGLNTHTFTTPFNWNGISNVIVEVCHDVVSGGSSSTIDQETISNRTIYSNTTGACALTTGNANTIRPVITFAAQVGTNVSSSINFVWNPGSIPTNTAVVTPINPGATAITQIYTVTATNPATGCTNTATTSVVVNPIPVSPVAFNSTQCGVAIPTASVTGGTSYKWYATPTATNAIQSGTSQTYTSSIGTTTNFYVTSFNGNCESPRVTVTASVTIPDGLTASVGTASICPSTTVALLSTKTGTANTYAYTWTASPVAGSGIPTSVSGGSVIITPTLSGTYVYTVTGVDAGCTAVATTTLSVFQALTSAPPAIATPNPLCAGGSATLSTTVPTTIAVGTGNTTLGVSNSGGGLSPYSQYYEGQRTQYLFKASELSALGLTAGGLSGMSFNVTSALTTLPFTNYTIKMYHTAATDLAASYATASGAATTVFGPVTLNAPTAGVNNIAFTSNFNWDGSSNIIVDICFENDAAAAGIFYTDNSIVAATTVSGYTSVRGDYADNSSLCNTANVGTSTTSTNRPNVIFTKAAAYTFTWTAGSAIGNTNPIVVTPTTTTTYTALVTDNNGCSINSAPVTVTVNPIPVVTAVASTSTSCASSSLTLTAGGATTYSWMPAGGTATIAVVSPTTSTIYTLTGTALGCSSTNTVAISVTPNPTVVATISPSVICAGATVSLTATGATSYTWSPVSAFTASTTATPTVNTTYSVTGSSLGCNNTKTVSVIVNNVPTLTITTNPASGILCGVGSAGILSATGTGTAYVWSNGPTTSTNVVTPTATTNYTVSATNTCGTSTAVATMSVGLTPTITATSSASLICKGNPVVLTASGTAGIAYSWNTGATTTSISVTPTTTTVYTVTGSNACGTATAVITQSVSPCTGIEEVYGTTGISIYPNPANDHVNIEISSSLVSNHTTVEITDALGKLVMQETLGTEITRINISKLEEGVYFFKVSTNNQTVKVGKVVKQ